MLETLNGSTQVGGSPIDFTIAGLPGVEKDIEEKVQALEKIRNGWKEIQEGYKALRLPISTNVDRIVGKPEPRKSRTSWGPIYDQLPHQFTMKDVKRISGSSSQNATAHCKGWCKSIGGQAPKAVRVARGVYVKTMPRSPQ